MSKKTIFIATPMYGGNCSGIFAESLALAFKGLIDLGYDVKYCPLYNESLITRGRNLLADIFLKENADYLLFIDSDQSFDYTDIHRMILEDKEILGAIVPMKKINWEIVRYAALAKENDIEKYSGIFNFNIKEDGILPDFTKPFEVECIGTGMMLIKKEVLLSIKEACPSYKHNLGEIFNIKNGDLITEFFTTSIDEKGYLLSEDFHFCKIAKEKNYKIYAVAYPKIAHAGTYFFKGMIK